MAGPCATERGLAIKRVANITDPETVEECADALARLAEGWCPICNTPFDSETMLCGSNVAYQVTERQLSNLRGVLSTRKGKR